MWHDPYLETCCRSALHRLFLAGEVGRPEVPSDEPCLARLAALELSVMQADRRHRLTAKGAARHEQEILKIAERLMRSFS